MPDDSDRTILVRSLDAFEVRTDDDGSMTLEGVAVPWGETIDLGGYREQFERGAFDTGRADQGLYAEHGHLRGDLPVGRIVGLSDEDDGLHLRARISNTERGREVHQLLKDGALHGLSVGFQPVSVRNEDDGSVTHLKSELREASVTGFPAYRGAQVTGVRSEQGAPNTTTSERSEENEEEGIMPTEQIEQGLTEVRSSIEDLSRRFTVLEEGAAPASGDVTMLDNEFRSYGDYVRAFAQGDHRAEALFRAWTGGTSADSVVQNTWVGDLTKIIDKPRKVLNSFSTAPLPPEGLTLEYATLGSDSTAVTGQTSEGSTLAYGKVAITTKTASVKTYGGYTSMSRQEIERANVNILDTAFRAMAAKYAKATEAAVRSAMTAASPSTTDTTGVSTFDDWIGFLVEAAAILDDKGLALDGVIVDQNTFKAAAKLKDTNTYLLDRNQGSVNITGLSGSVLSVPMIVISSTSTVVEAFSQSAIRTYESAGAPARLGPDNDITNLTGAYSVYGYLAVAVEDEKALVVPGT